MIKLAIYGKGGIGKSTVTSNLSAAFAMRGKKVIQIGCDPKADSTGNLLAGKPLMPVMNYLREHDEDPTSLEEITARGFGNVLCIETGGPTPGLGCAGRGIISTFNLLDDLRLLEREKPDVVLFDVLGDVVCGGFAAPLRDGYADVVLVVTSGEMMALYAAGNICTAVRDFAQYSNLTLGGLLINKRNIEHEEERIAQFIDEVKVPVFGTIPRSTLVQDAEELGRTVVARFPESDQAAVYRNIAARIIETWGGNEGKR